MPSQKLERWNNDGESLKSQFEQAGYSVDLRFSENDADQQNADINGMLKDGVTAVVSLVTTASTVST